MKHERGHQVRRQWLLLGLLASLRYGRTLDQLAEALSCHPRTVRRDLDVLGTVGFDFERNHEGEGIAVRIVWPTENIILNRLGARAIESREVSA